MSDVASARRKVTALLNVRGCTPPEAEQRLAKAAQLAEAAGIRQEFRQLLRPGERQPRSAQNERSERLRRELDMWLAAELTRMHAERMARVEMQERRDRAVGVLVRGLVSAGVACLLLNLAGRYAGAHGWPLLGWVLWLWSFVALVTGMFRTFSRSSAALRPSA